MSKQFAKIVTTEENRQVLFRVVPTGDDASPFEVKVGFYQGPLYAEMAIGYDSEESAQAMLEEADEIMADSFIDAFKDNFLNNNENKGEAENLIE